MKDIFRCAIVSLSRKWGRTALTVCSIAVGVTMVVIVSFISGAGRLVVNNELESMGISGLSVSTNAIAGDTGSGLTSANLETIRGLSDVETAMPLMIQYSTSLLRDTQSNALICGLDSGAKQVISLKLRYGRMISKSDVKSSAMVCVLDETVAKEAYRRGNVTGKTISLQIGGVMEDFTIVGVSETGSSLLQNVVEFIPGMVYIPYTTMQSLTGRDNFDQIAVRVGADADVNRTESRILDTLQRTTGLSGYYRADNLAAQRDQLTGLMDVVTLILTIISGISLIVSGLGIMTIMLVSVNERTREIGVKKAIGASRGRVMLEFLMESVIISLLGSIAGILLGGTVSLIGLSLMGASAPIDAGSLLGLVGFAVITGAVFGVYPAIKASRLRPVDALRVE